MMNFRQRMGWMGVCVYLLCSIAAVYYVFEIQRFSLEHVAENAGAVAEQQQPPPHPPLGGAAAAASPPVPPPPASSSSSLSWAQSMKSRLMLLPAWAWAAIFLVPYLQVFLFLYSCTRADPKTLGYCILPVCLAVLCNRHTSFTKASNQISRLHLIDT